VAEQQFYAARGDVGVILELVFALEWHLYEQYSKMNRELRRFVSAEEVLAAYDARFPERPGRPAERGSLADVGTERPRSAEDQAD
jgi:hypothetical protein